MGRMNEALRRLNGPAGSQTLPDPQDKVFDSPWAVGDGPQFPAPAETPRNGSGGAEPLQDKADPAGAPEQAFADPQGAPGLLSYRSPDALTGKWKEWFVSPDLDPGILEQFRRLAATLLHGQREGRLKVVMVTSAVPGEGKTLAALNTALVLAESYRRRVLLVDADLRRPRLSEAAGQTVSGGLSEALKAPEERKVPVTQLGEYLWFLPAGRPDPEPLSGLTSTRMKHLLEEASERFDWVIVDTPPVSAAADAGLLAATVDATVMVIKAGQTPHPAVRHAIDTIGHERIFGVVLNGVVPEPRDGYSTYSYGSGSGTKTV